MRRILCPGSLATVALVWMGLEASGAGAAATHRPTSVARAASPASHSNAAASTDTVADEALHASTAEPWNPPHPLAPRRMWEQALLLPERIVSLPLSGLGWATERSLGWAENHDLVRFTALHSATHAPVGVRLRFQSLGDGSGVGIGAGAQARLPGPLPLGLRASGAISYHDYDTALLSAGVGPLAIEYDHDWRPRERFYGLGMGAAEGDRTSYALERQNARVAWRWSDAADTARSGRRDRIEAFAESQDEVERRGKDPNAPSYEQLFPAVAGPMLDRRIDHTVYGLQVSTDGRIGVPHWGAGGRLSAAVERHDDPIGALALRSGQPLGARFTRIVFEGEAAQSFMRDPRTIRLLVRVVDQSVDARRDRMLVSDLVSLGGKLGLAGYAPGRFHEVDGMLGRLTYLFPLGRWTEFDLHSEAGAVYGDVWRDATIRSLHPSFGMTLRARDATHVLGAIGFDASREALRIRYVLGSVE